MKKIASSLLAAAFALALPLAGPALGQEEFRIMAPAGPGGGYDQTARSMQQVLMELGLAKDVQVYNVPGAGGTIGLAQFVRQNKGNPGAMMMSADTMIGATITNKSPVGIDAVTPLARLTSDYHIIVVPTSSGLKTMGDLVAMLKNDPGKVSWAGGSAGGSDHVAAALIARAVGVEPGKLNYVAFSGGGESLAAVLSGAYTVGINTYSELSGQVQSGRLRALAIASPAPVPGFNAPTLKQSGIDLITRTWRFVAGAPELTAAQRTAVTEKLTIMARSAQWAKISESKGWQGDFLTGAQLDAFVADEKKNINAVLVELGLAK